MPETQVVAAREQNKYYTYADIFYVNRHSFFTAGQDSYTLPPAQNQDMFLALTNVEPVTQGILQRRRGYSLFSSQAPVNPFTRAYSYRNESLALRRYIWTSTSQILATDEAGAVITPNLLTPSNGARPPRMVLSRDYGFFADGVGADYKKWNGTLGTLNLTQWGISIGQTAASTIGPRPAATATSIASSSVPWTNPSNALVADGAFATCLSNFGNSSQILEVSNFGFSTVGVIVGIQVDVKYTGTNPANYHDAEVFLMKNGSIPGAQKSLLPIPATNTQLSFGGPTDLWGSTWLPGDINSSGFGVGISFLGLGSTGATLEIDYVQVTVFELGSSLTVGAPGTGLITLLSGRTYFATFQNSTTGSNSTVTTASSSTGPLTNNNVPLSNLPISSDPQVDTVNILATADGNDQTTLFLIGSVPNGTTTFTDNMPDPVLLTQPVFQYTDINQVLHGVVNNNPPPAGDFPVKHKGRIYMAQGHNLFFSKNLDEITTSTGTITSRWEEAWPALNQIDISEFAETIRAILSDGETLWIATERNIRRLIGDSPQNFQKPEVQFNECGVLNQEVWKVVFYEGQPVGTMWLTPDNRVMVSDFNNYQDVGTHIQDVLNTINPNALVGPHAAFVSQQAFDLYMLYLPTGNNAQPDTVCVYNLRTRLWSIWKPTDLATVSLFNISALGQPQWLFASNAGPLYFWDATTLQDRNGNGPLTYPVTIQTTWMDFGDYNIRKFVNQIIPTTADNTAMTVQVDAASNEQDFNVPLNVVPPTTVIPAAIPDDVFVPLASGPSHSRAFRFTFVSPPSTIQNILTGFAIEAGAFHRYVWWLVAGSGLWHLFKYMGGLFG